MAMSAVANLEPAPLKSSLKVGVYTITPTTAKQWLENNTSNRPIATYRVEALARDITDGKWKLNGQTISFAKDDTLIDGQHRLAAVVEANKSIKSLVVHGLEKNVFDTVDMGMKRSTAQMLRTMGETYVVELAAVTKLLIAFERREFHALEGGKGRYYATTQEQLAALELHPKIRESVAKLSGGHVLGGSLGSKAIATVIHYYGTRSRNAAAADIFVERLMTGEELKRGSPILALRRQLIKNYQAGVRRQRPGYLLPLYIPAWNAWARGESIDRLVPVDLKDPKNWDIA